MSDLLLGDSYTSAVEVPGDGKSYHVLLLSFSCRDFIAFELPGARDLASNQEDRKKTCLSFFRRSNGIQDLFVNWKAWKN